MKNIFFAILLIFIFFNCKNNKKIEIENLEKEQAPPPPPKKIEENSLIGFACYYEGRRSQPVENITEILKRKNYKELKKKLSSLKPAEKYLATFVCIKLLEKRLLKLDNNELGQINENKKSELKIYFCGGCTEKNDYKLSQLFSEKIKVKKEVEDWFNQIR